MNAFIQFIHPSDRKKAIERGDNKKEILGYRQLASQITRRNAASAFEFLNEEECLELINDMWKNRNTWQNPFT